MNEVRTLAKQTAVYGFGTIVPRFLNYGVFAIFYTRIFQKAEYGVVTELYAWMAILLIVLTYGMETGFFRFAQKKEDYEKVYSTSLISLFGTSVLFLVLVFLFIGPVSAVLDYPDHHDFVMMTAAIMAIDAFCAIPFARLRKENRPGIFSIIKIANVVINVVAVLFLLLVAPKVWQHSDGWFRKVYDPGYRVGYVFVANLIGSIATLLMLLPFIVKVKPGFEKSLWQRMIIYSFPLLIAGLSGSLNDVLDKVLLRRVLGNETGLETVGVYGAGYKVAVLMSLFIQMFRFAAEPFFFERAKKENAKETYAYVMKYFVIAMLLVFLGINLYITGFKFIIGPNFRESLIVVPIVSMGYLLYGIYLNHSIWYKLNDLTRFGIYITLIGALITILINIFLIPVYGYMASAWAHVASYGAMIIMSFIFASKHYKIEYRMGELIPYFLIAIAMVIFSRLFNYNSTAIEIILNTFLIVIFILFAQYRDKVLTVFFKKAKMVIQGKIRMNRTYLISIIILVLGISIFSCNRKIVPSEISGVKIKPYDTATFNYIFVEAVKMKLLGNGGDALKLLEQGIKINPQSDAVYFQMAQILIASGDMHNGKKYALKAWTIDQKNFWYLMMLAGAYYQEKNLDSAIIFYDKAVKYFPGKEGLQVTLANLYSENKKFDKAAQIYESIDKQYGINESSSAGVVKNLMWAGKWDEALEHASILLKEYPDVILYNGLLAEIYRGKG